MEAQVRKYVLPLLALVVLAAGLGTPTALAGDEWFGIDKVRQTGRADAGDWLRGDGDDDDDDDGPAGEKCKKVNGHATWTLIPSPNDPFGRILGPSTGDLKAAISAHVTGLVPGDGGALHATSVEVWVLGAQDILVMDGEATFTPIPGQPVGTVHDELSLTITDGTGAYEGASGSIEVRGIGYNIFGPDSGPGKGYFDVRYRGTVCRPR